MMKIRILFTVVWLLVSATVQAEGQAPQLRNVIYMIGDGMGLAQVSMLQLEENFAPTAFDRAQGIALVKTRSANNRVTDSAAAGTALSSGYKTNNAMLGQTPDGEPVPSMMSMASKKGLATGIVVTSYLQHATPASFYAHVENRNQSSEITREMLNCGVDVLLGGGGRWFSKGCAECGGYFEAFRSRGYRVAESLEQIENHTRGRLLGVLADDHLPKASERDDYLPRATSKALEILSADSREKGFLLMVEGSMIDMACHANDVEWLLDEMRDFNRAINVAMDFADRNPGTLVVVVADHETGGFTIPGRKTDFTLPESGIGYDFSGKGHTGMLIPVYLYGTCADQIKGVMENSELAHRIMDLRGLRSAEM